MDASVVHDRHLAVEEDTALLGAAVGEGDAELCVAPHERTVSVQRDLD